jgi:hypothetical protein
MMTSPDKTGDGRKARFLEPSPFDGDRGEKIGVDPRKIPTSDLRDLGTPGKLPKNNPGKVPGLRR